MIYPKVKPSLRLILLCLLVPMWIWSVAGDARGEPWAQGWVPDVFVHSELDAQEIVDGQYAVVVEKSRQILHLLQFRESWHLLESWPCSTGKKPGPKRMEGDFRTPEGIYFIERYVPERFLSDVYGACALPLNYPNWLDRMAHRTGSAIWLHGTDRALKARDSNGCVVLDNDHIKALAARIKAWRTPVIILDRLNCWAEKEADLWAGRLKDLVGQWQDDLMGGSYGKYKQWYASGASATMDWWHRWCRLRNATSGAMENGRMTARNFDILKHDEVFLIQFDQFLEAHGGWTSVVRRQLFVKMVDGQPKIIGDQDIESLDGDKHKSVDADPLFAAWRDLVRQSGVRPLFKGSTKNNQES